MQKNFRISSVSNIHVQLAFIAVFCSESWPVLAKVQQLEEAYGCETNTLRIAKQFEPIS